MTPPTPHHTKDSIFFVFFPFFFFCPLWPLLPLYHKFVSKCHFRFWALGRFTDYDLTKKKGGEGNFSWEGRFGLSPFNINKFLTVLSPITVTSKFPNLLQSRKITSHCVVYSVQEIRYFQKDKNFKKIKFYSRIKNVNQIHIPLR